MINVFFIDFLKKMFLLEAISELCELLLEK